MKSIKVYTPNFVHLKKKNIYIYSEYFSRLSQQ